MLYYLFYGLAITLFVLCFVRLKTKEALMIRIAIFMLLFIASCIFIIINYTLYFITGHRFADAIMSSILIMLKVLILARIAFDHYALDKKTEVENSKNNSDVVLDSKSIHVVPIIAEKAHKQKINIKLNNKENKIMFYTKKFNTPIYEEPSFDYIIVKTKIETVAERGGFNNVGLYNAARYCWKIGPRVEQYNYVFCVIDKVVQEVYKAKYWEYITDSRYGKQYNNRYEFVGEPASREIANQFIGKQLPECYTKKGLASPILFSKN